MASVPKIQKTLLVQLSENEYQGPYFSSVAEHLDKKVAAIVCQYVLEPSPRFQSIVKDTLQLWPKTLIYNVQKGGRFRFTLRETCQLFHTLQKAKSEEKLSTAIAKPSNGTVQHVYHYGNPAFPLKFDHWFFLIEEITSNIQEISKRFVRKTTVIKYFYCTARTTKFSVSRRIK